MPAPPQRAGLWQTGPPGDRWTRSSTGLRQPCMGGRGPRFLQGFPGTPLREGALSSDASAHLSLPSTMSSFLTIWLDYYEEDFHDPPEFPALRKLLNFTGQYLPGSVLHCRAECYLWRFINLHQAEFVGGGEEDWGGRVGDRVGHTDQASVLLGRSSG